MKTVIQELIEELKANDVAHGMYWIKRPSDFFEKYLEKEKEQIKEAFINGEDGVAAEEYYNQTYNQQKQHIIDIMKADEDDELYKLLDTDPDKKY